MTEDERAGIDWWNSLSEADRRFWLAAACSSVVADAWAYFKRANPRTRSVEAEGRPSGEEVSRGH